MNVYLSKVDITRSPITTLRAGRILSLPGKVERCAEPRVCWVYCSLSAIMEYLSGLAGKDYIMAVRCDIIIVERAKLSSLASSP